jgi:lysozyme
MELNTKAFGPGHSFERVFTPAFVLFVKRWEAFKGERYPDGKREDGSTVWSIGYGHAEDGDNPPTKIPELLTLSEEEATAILIKDIKSKAHFIDVRVKVPVTTFQFEALTSFCFQYGNGRMDKTGIFPHLNAGDYEGAADIMLDLYKTRAGKPLRGLRFRRAAEVTWYLTRKD